ncbi:Lrp/AsnC family transcriptional regulator [Nocardioides sp. GY 10113]|uniref:Lrp/AsnC family transcriptional regulator n=1 Tax=Nocardioides sp. GY 10113 TaxID=2569761 RepID=UPI0010A76F1E|nr:Lrp/AsnC family transcriptional regulator [Nocardioides sp. GY 10113]TIC84875.1 Lrp/AsnC family transcriptional regulator [Nocardioides sp. GY 10113]
MELDQLDLALLTALRDRPRAGPLELSRLLSVARATVQARIQRLEDAGVITGYGPDVDLEAAGHPLSAFVTLEIAQGALEEVASELEAIPTILEAYVTTGTADVVCRVAAADHADLQDTLLDLNRSGSVVRSTSVVVLGTLIRPRVLPLLRRTAASRASRSPSYR